MMMHGRRDSCRHEFEVDGFRVKIVLCTFCGGSGVDYSQLNFDGSARGEVPRCPACKGRGNEQPIFSCPKCKSTDVWVR